MYWEREIGSSGDPRKRTSEIIDYSIAREVVSVELEDDGIDSPRLDNQQKLCTAPSFVFSPKGISRS